MAAWLKALQWQANWTGRPTHMINYPSTFQILSRLTATGFGAAMPPCNRRGDGPPCTVAVIRLDEVSGGGRQSGAWDTKNRGPSMERERSGSSVSVLLITLTGKTVVCHVDASCGLCGLADAHHAATGVPAYHIYFLINGRPPRSDQRGGALVAAGDVVRACGRLTGGMPFLQNRWSGSTGASRPDQASAAASSSDASSSAMALVRRERAAEWASRAAAAPPDASASEGDPPLSHSGPLAPNDATCETCHRPWD